MAPRKFSDQEILDAVDATTNFSAAAKLLGTAPETVRKRANKLGRQSPTHHRRTSYSEDELREAVSNSWSFSQVLRELGLVNSGSRQTKLKNEIRRLDIDTGHFTGQAHNKGAVSNQRLTADLVFIVRSEGERRQRHILRRCLLEDGCQEICAECGVGTTWNSKSLRLEIDHIDGNKLNDMRSNLRFLCPNCHKQTPTWGNTKSRGCIPTAEEAG